MIKENSKLRTNKSHNKFFIQEIYSFIQITNILKSTSVLHIKKSLPLQMKFVVDLSGPSSLGGYNNNWPRNRGVNLWGYFHH